LINASTSLRHQVRLPEAAIISPRTGHHAESNLDQERLDRAASHPKFGGPRADFCEARLE